MVNLLSPFGILVLVVLIYSAILHEIAHGYVADRLGDPTARLMGRLTLNPIPHIDPVMSIALPLILILSGSPVIFGGAKPVPVDPFNLPDGRRDFALVSAAGPLTNVILAVIAAAILHIGFAGQPLSLIQQNVIGYLLVSIMEINLLLAFFNLIPIPPLDGSKIFALILPEREADTYLSLGNTFGMLILLFLLFFPIGGFSLMGLISTFLQFGIHLLGF